MATPQINIHCINTCNSLLRGELSAVVTYDQAIEKFAGEPQVTSLDAIRKDHQVSVSKLQEAVISWGGKPDIDSGAWGTFAQAIQGTANFFGESSALASLKQGEEHGKKSYEDVLEDEDFPDGFKEVIRGELLPRIEKHLVTLEAVSASV